MAKENILRVEDISKTFPGTKALKNVSLELVKGEVHAIVGENGAGKSTLMNILSGVLRADDGGKIFFNGISHFNCRLLLPIFQQDGDTRRR